METITPHDLRRIGNLKEKHEHNWAFYEGCLGYESLICLECGIDKNDLDANKIQDIDANLNQLKQLLNNKK